MEPLRLPQVVPLVPPRLPEPLPLQAPVLELPRAEVPSYTPLVYPYADGTFSGGSRINTKATEDDDQDKKPPETLVPPIKAPAPRVQVPQYQIPDKKPAESDLPQLAEATTITLPGTDIKIPVPRAEIVSAAAITSVISVTATLTATALFKRLVFMFKPVISASVKKIDKMRKKKPITFGRQRWELRRHRRLHKVKKDGSYILPS